MVEDAALVLLAFTVVVIGLAQLHVYRLLTGHTPAAAPRQWPLSEELRPGVLLPAWVLAALPGGFTGLLVLSPDDGVEAGAAVSADAVATEWDVRLEVVTRGAADLGEVLATNDPVVVAVRDGRVVDATREVVGPSVLASELQYARQAVRAPKIHHLHAAQPTEGVGP